MAGWNRWLLLLVAIAEWSSVDAAGTTLVFGLGPALVAMIVLLITCLLLCIFGYSAQHRR